MNNDPLEVACAKPENSEAFDRDLNIQDPSDDDLCLQSMTTMIFQIL